ncbi:capsid assembly scaffolding protein Gp46 family protein [Faecalibaculum rodentium]|uniref:capsid assembly scaffolding protein Gp46 family protein n=1 Tax=Faecalibaculum rodentium TaxID=1702221 RepID=UPI0023EF7110|nr:DUF4355 domain-containing protein [Faecalibaculum rodentium]
MTEFIKSLYPRYDLQLFAEGAAETTPAAPQGNEPPGQNQDPLASLTDAQQSAINQLIAGRIKREQEKAADKARKEAEAAEAERLKNMSEAERNAQRMKDLEEKVHRFELEKQENAMMKAARDELQTRGYSFADTVISRLIGADAEETKASIDEFTKAFDAAVDEAVKKRVHVTEPKAGATSTLTREQIMAEKDRAKRLKLISDNMELFKN